MPLQSLSRCVPHGLNECPLCENDATAIRAQLAAKDARIASLESHAAFLEARVVEVERERDGYKKKLDAIFQHARDLQLVNDSDSYEHEKATEIRRIILEQQP